MLGGTAVSCAVQRCAALPADVRENRAFASEIKFLIDPMVADQIRDWTSGRMTSDPNSAPDLDGSYRVTSLYFDTERFDVFHRQGSFGRCKYRIRRYGESDLTFLERKLKTRGLLSKRRSMVNAGELHSLGARELCRGWAGGWFHRRLLARQLRPVCQISYGRTARVSWTDLGPARLTLDRETRATVADQPAFRSETGALNLIDKEIILELKFRGPMPALFKRLLEEFALTPQPVSKYRLAVAALGLVTVDQNEAGEDA
jgi:hypothetical protein